MTHEIHAYANTSLFSVREEVLFLSTCEKRINTLQESHAQLPRYAIHAPDIVGREFSEAGYCLEQPTLIGSSSVVENSLGEVD